MNPILKITSKNTSVALKPIRCKQFYENKSQ